MILNIENLMKEIYAELGPGHSERVYHNAVEVMLREKRIRYETERIIPVVFRGHVIGNVRADIIIDGRCILEFKTIRTLGDGAELQAHNYLRLTGLNLAYLDKFSSSPWSRGGGEKNCARTIKGRTRAQNSVEFSTIIDSVSADLSQLLPGVPEPEIDDV
jgi:GxxExxY protein